MKKTTVESGSPEEYRIARRAFLETVLGRGLVEDASDADVVVRRIAGIGYSAVLNGSAEIAGAVVIGRVSAMVSLEPQGSEPIDNGRFLDITVIVLADIDAGSESNIFDSLIVGIGEVIRFPVQLASRLLEGIREAFRSVNDGDAGSRIPGPKRSAEVPVACDPRIERSIIGRDFDSCPDNRVVDELTPYIGQMVDP